MAPIYTDRAWWTVEDAARLLRVNVHTLYRACQRDDFPHKRIGPYIRIPAEALRLTVRPETKTRTYHLTDDAGQYTLDLGPIVPVRRWRNTGEPIAPFAYEGAMYAARKRSRKP